MRRKNKNATAPNRETFVPYIKRYLRTFKLKRTAKSFKTEFMAKSKGTGLLVDNNTTSLEGIFSVWVVRGTLQLRYENANPSKEILPYIVRYIHALGLDDTMEKLHRDLRRAQARAFIDDEAVIASIETMFSMWTSNGSFRSKYADEGSDTESTDPNSNSESE
jgi:hypothetical protein